MTAHDPVLHEPLPDIHEASWLIAVPPMFYLSPDSNVGVVVAVVREERANCHAVAFEWCANTTESKRAAISRVVDFLAHKGIPVKEAIPCEAE